MTLSPAQTDRLESLRARFPATMFDVLNVDPYSCCATVECEDLETFGHLAITADGRNVPDRIALQWASTH